jgi:hypothetical protein
MNCKPGDLAIVVGGHGLGNDPLKMRGRIVRCIRILGPADLGFEYDEACPTWEVDIDVKDPIDGVQIGVEDEFLRPIRDNDGEDEILRIAGKPEKVNA